MNIDQKDNHLVLINIAIIIIKIIIMIIRIER